MSAREAAAAARAAGGSAARGHLFALFTVVVWGTTFVATKVLLVDFAPIEILFYRFLIGFLVLWACRPRHVKLGGWREEALVAAAGLTGVVLYFLFENIALTYTTASNVGVIVAVNPFFTALLSSLLLRDEKLHPVFFAGFALAMAGIVLISWEGLGTGGVVGDALAVAAAAVWAFYAVLTRKLALLCDDTIQMTKRTFAWGLVLMVPALFLLDFQFGLERFADPLMSANMLFLGVGASAACFATWGIAVKLLGAVKTSAYIYLVPVITVAASVLVLGEPLTPQIGVGVVLTCAGLVLSERGKGAPPAEAAAVRGGRRDRGVRAGCGRHGSPRLRGGCARPALAALALDEAHERLRLALQVGRRGVQREHAVRGLDGDMGDGQAGLVHDARIQEAEHAHELLLRMRRPAHADAGPGQRHGLAGQHLALGLAHGTREPVDQVLQRAGDGVVVLGAEQPQPVGPLDLVAHARHGGGRGVLGVLVHERDVVPGEQLEACLGAQPAQRRPCGLGELAVVASLSKRSGDGEYVHGVPPDPLMLSSWCHMVARSTGRCLVWR